MVVTIKEQLANQRVARGVALLDRHEPGWWVMVDKEDLQILNPRHCVLRHVFGGYVSGLAVLGLAYTEALAYGFTASEVSAPYVEAAWQEEIRKREGRLADEQVPTRQGLRHIVDQFLVGAR